MRVFVVIFSLVILFTVNSQTYGQTNEQIDISEYIDVDGYSWESQYAEEIQTDWIILEIGKDHKVRVTHVVEGNAWSPATPKLIKMLPGEHSNLELTDEDGDYLRPLGFVGETFEDSEFIIAGQKAFNAFDLHASYDLENFLELDDDGLWSKHIKFPHDVEIFIDEEIDIVFVNSRPVDISNAGGINCMGCDLKIEFFDDAKPIKKTVVRNDVKFEEISNTGEEFTLEFITDGEIGDVNFINELNYLSFESKENQLFLLKIPLDLLLSPYHVYVTEIDDEYLQESNKIRSTGFKQTDTHADISFRPISEGTVHVVGSDEMEHKKLLTKLKEISDKIPEEKVTDTSSQTEKVEEKSEVDLYAEWGDSKENNDEEDYTAIIVIIGVVAAIIIGVIIKLKRN